MALTLQSLTKFPLLKESDAENQIYMLPLLTFYCHDWFIEQAFVDCVRGLRSEGPLRTELLFDMTLINIFCWKVKELRDVPIMLYCS